VAKLPQDPKHSSFSKGEVSPDLYGRTDLKWFEHALRRCHNGIITPQGAWKNRPGTMYVAPAVNETQAVRLVPFLFSNGQNCVLEFGDLYFRVIQNTGVVSITGDNVSVFGGQKFIGTPYPAAELFQLKFAQQGDVITIVHPNHYPQRLARLAADCTQWDLRAMDFTTMSADAMTANGKGPLELAAGYIQVDPGTTHPPKPWQWCVTSISGGLESGPTNVVSAPGTGLICCYPDMPVKVQSHLATGGAADSTFMVYRGKNGVFGLVGSCAGNAGTVSFVDDGTAPDFSIQPPKGVDPFAGFSAGRYPSAVVYYQQRLVFSAKGKIWASAVGNYGNFNEGPLLTDDAAFSFYLASQAYEEVRSFLPMRVLLALTNQKDWATTGAFSKSQITLQPNNVRGAAWLDPTLVGATALYVQDGLQTIYELAYAWTEQSYLGSDVTLAARHMFAAHSIKDWTYAQLPFSIVWVVRDDGKLLGLTYVKDQEVLAWHWHDTQGYFEAVCAIPEATETNVYVVVRRQINGVWHRYVEVLASRIGWRTNDDTIGGTYNMDGAVFLDSAVYESGNPSTILGYDTGHSLSHLEGMAVMVLGDGVAGGPYTVVGGQIDISADFPDGVTHATVGLSYVAEGETLRSVLTGGVKTVQRIQFDVVESRGLWWGPDFDHLREWQQRTVKDSYGAVALFSGTDHIRIPNTYDHEARVCWRVTDPLPVTIIGITRELDLGGG
jgi:hypothetical protein